MYVPQGVAFKNDAITTDISVELIVLEIDEVDSMPMGWFGKGGIIAIHRYHNASLFINAS